MIGGQSRTVGAITLDALAVEVREGVAAVAPRDVRVTCQRCGGNRYAGLAY
jgi:hypothetical protein